jgi:flagellar biosynthesis GTPase FlhF
MLGLLVSALTKRSTVSFLVLLVAWVLFVLILPRAATMAAGQFIEVPSIAEIESQKDRFRTDRWAAYSEERSAEWQERMRPVEGMNEEDRAEYMEERREAWMQEDDGNRQVVQEEIAEFERKVNEDLRNRKAEQERLAFILSRFSPSSSYQLATMNLAGTNTTLKTRYEESMKAYRTAFSQFVEAKRIEERRKMMEQQRGQRRVMIFGGAGDEAVDASELPRYEAPAHTFAEAFSPSMIDVGLLALFSVICFGGAFAAFLRYDVR